jgi:hypothetical protein
VKTATEKAKNEYLDSMCEDITWFQKNRMLWFKVCEDKKLRSKENPGIQNVGINASQEIIIVDQRQVLEICENYITELYDRANRAKNLKVEAEEEVDEDEKGPYILHS